MAEILYATPVIREDRPRIFHVGSREMLQKLRDDIFRLHGFEVESTHSLGDIPGQVSKGMYDLVLIDIEGDNRVAAAVQLCNHIKEVLPHQYVAYVCNYWVSINSDCPDKVIRSEFDPEALVRSVRQVLANRQRGFLTAKAVEALDFSPE